MFLKEFRVRLWLGKKKKKIMVRVRIWNRVWVPVRLLVTVQERIWLRVCFGVQGRFRIRLQVKVCVRLGL